MKKIKIISGKIVGVIALILLAVAYSFIFNHGVYIGMSGTRAMGVGKDGAPLLSFDVHLVNLTPLKTTVYVVPECGCTTVSQPILCLSAFHWTTVHGVINTTHMKPGLARRGIAIAFENSATKWSQRVEEHFIVHKAAHARLYGSMPQFTHRHEWGRYAMQAV